MYKTLFHNVRGLQFFSHSRALTFTLNPADGAKKSGLITPALPPSLNSKHERSLLLSIQKIFMRSSSSLSVQSKMLGGFGLIQSKSNVTDTRRYCACLRFGRILLVGIGRSNTWYVVAKTAAWVWLLFYPFQEIF